MQTDDLEVTFDAEDEDTVTFLAFCHHDQFDEGEKSVDKLDWSVSTV